MYRPVRLDSHTRLWLSRRSVWVSSSPRRSVWYGGGVYGYDPLSIESMGIDLELDCVTRGTHRGSRPQRPQPTGPSRRTPCWGLMRDSATRGRGTRALKTMSTTTFQLNTPFLRLSCLPACRTTRHGQTRGQFRKSTCTIIQSCGPTTSLFAMWAKDSPLWHGVQQLFGMLSNNSPLCHLK